MTPNCTMVTLIFYNAAGRRMIRVLQMMDSNTIYVFKKGCYAHLLGTDFLGACALIASIMETKAYVLKHRIVEQTIDYYVTRQIVEKYRGRPDGYKDWAENCSITHAQAGSGTPGSLCDWLGN